MARTTTTMGTTRASVAPPTAATAHPVLIAHLAMANTHLITLQLDGAPATGTSTNTEIMTTATLAVVAPVVVFAVTGMVVALCARPTGPFILTTIIATAGRQAIRQVVIVIRAMKTVGIAVAVHATVVEVRSHCITLQVTAAIAKVTSTRPVMFIVTVVPPTLTPVMTTRRMRRLATTHSRSSTTSALAQRTSSSAHPWSPACQPVSRSLTARTTSTTEVITCASTVLRTQTV